MNNLIRTRHAILEAINAIDEVLVSKPFSQPISISQNQLQQFRSTLLQMLLDTMSIDQPIRDAYCGGMGRGIADSWPLNNSLGDAILNAEQMYLSVMNK